MTRNATRVPVTPGQIYLLHSDRPALAAACRGMRAADVADALRQVAPEAAARIVAALPFELAVQVLDEPELHRHRSEIIRLLDGEVAGPLIDAMSSDEQAKIFRELTDADRARLLAAVRAKTRGVLELLLRYPPDSAAGLMTTEFVTMPATWSVDEGLRLVAAVGHAKETVYAIYVLDPDDQRLVHVVSLRELMTADRQVLVADVGDRREPISVVPLTDREEVAHVISRYNLLAVPVIDEAGCVMGIVTVDDVIDAIIREQTEDVQKLGGVESFDQPFMEVSFATMLRKRAGWLTILFFGEMLTATALGHFEAEIAHAVVLALFIPLIISSGGNSGGQSTSLIIRGMALGEIRLRDWWRVARRDVPTGVALGSILGSIAVARILVWQATGLSDYGAHYLRIAATVGTSVLGVVMFGSFTGAMLPFLIKRIGFDPATASAPFVATLVDVTGILIYFSVALLILRGTLL